MLRYQPSAIHLLLLNSAQIYVNAGLTLQHGARKAHKDEFSRMLQTGFPCVSGSFVLELKAQECNYDNFLAAYETVFSDDLNKSPSCTHTAVEDLALHFGTTTSELGTAIMTACHEAMDLADTLSFDDIPNSKDPNFVKTFYDGGTDWNEHVETLQHPSDGTTAEFSLREQEAFNVRSYFDGNTGFASNAALELPPITNFDLDTCELNAAMCCYVQDRQADDGNGNCDNGDNNDEYDTLCYDKDPGDNTDVCYVDFRRAPSSNGIASNGFAVYQGDNAEGEGNIHCHGFAWSNDDYHPYSRYKGNNLFYVSMYDHMYKRGYVRNLPGAPMCACVEQMPVVSRSDCTQVDVTESFKFIRNVDTAGFSGEVTHVDIDFNACQGVDRNNNLENFYQRLVSDELATTGQLTSLRDGHIVGDDQCDEAVAAFFDGEGYSSGFSDPNWTYVFGRRDLEQPGLDYSEKLFRAAFAAKPNQIVRRLCPNCKESHKDIYYRRITPLPDDMNFKFLLQSNWVSQDNTLGTDFRLFSSYSDALENDPAKSWTFCNYNDNTGFPRDCGPTAAVGCQWNSWTRGTCSDGSHVAFYLEKNTNFAPNVVPNTKQVGLSYGGNTYELDNTYYIQGGGYTRYQWGKDDNTHFSNDPMEGDFTMIGRVSDINQNYPDSKVGFMVRESLDKGSLMAMITLSPKYGVVFTHRYQVDYYTYSSDVINLIEADATIDNAWLMLKRVGQQFSGYMSNDGISWTPVGNTVTITDMPNSVLVGLAASSWSGSWTEGVISYYELHDTPVVADFGTSGSSVSIVASDDAELIITRNTMPDNRVEFVIELVSGGVTEGGNSTDTGSGRLLESGRKLTRFQTVI